MSINTSHASPYTCEMSILLDLTVNERFESIMRSRESLEKSARDSILRFGSGTSPDDNPTCAVEESQVDACQGVMFKMMRKVIESRGRAENVGRSWRANSEAISRLLGSAERISWGRVRCRKQKRVGNSSPLTTNFQHALATQLNLEPHHIHPHRTQEQLLGLASEFPSFPSFISVSNFGS